MLLKVCLIIVFFNCNTIHSQNNVDGCPNYPNIVPLNDELFTSILNKIDSYLLNVTTNENVPGFISTIVYDQKQIFTKGYGKRDIFDANSGPPSGNDLVKLASITKVYTDLLLYYLRDNGTYDVNLNDPVTKYLPNFSIKNPYNSDSIKLINLATQTSGLEREVPYCPNCNENDILTALSDKYLTLPPYTRFHYSNLGISVLGRSIEKVFCDGCYENKIKDIILDGLNCSIYSGFNYSNYIINNEMAVGVAGYANGKPIKASVESLGFENPAGGLLANANDVSKLIMFMFRNNITVNDYEYQILNGTTIEEILKPKIVLRDGYEAIGNPFEMRYREFVTNNGVNTGVWYKGKQGELSGYRSSVVLVPEYKIGIFNVALISDVSDSTVWTYNVLDMLIPYVDGLLYEYGNKYNYMLPNNYQLLIGIYKDEYGGIYNIKVSNSNGNSYLTVNNNEYRLELFMNRYNENIIYDNNVLRVINLHENTCREIDDGSDQELMYFMFNNGNNNHATQLIFMGNKYNYQT